MRVNTKWTIAASETTVNLGNQKQRDSFKTDGTLPFPMEFVAPMTLLHEEIRLQGTPCPP